MKSVKKVVFAAMAIAIASLGIQPAMAHHSGAGFGKDMKEITGTVKEFQFMNPHSWIQVNVPDANGKMVEWSVEWGSPNQIGARWNPSVDLPPGYQGHDEGPSDDEWPTDRQLRRREDARRDGGWQMGRRRGITAKPVR